jgi:putative SOS response-associated peptidase YedK
MFVQPTDPTPPLDHCPPLVRQGKEHRELVLMQWGLVPWFSIRWTWKPCIEARNGFHSNTSIYRRLLSR